MTGRFARQQIELRTNAFWRLHWRRAMPGTLSACLAGGIVAWLLPEVWFPLWMVIPMMVLAGLFALRPLIYATYHLEMGAEAEAWTSKELRKVCGPGWHVVDGISFAFHDVDHVLVGPGGVYAIETKYTDSRVDLTTRSGAERANWWAAQAIESARSIRLLLPNDFRILDVYPGVLVWGNEVSGTPHSVDGVPVLRRKDLDLPWMPWRNHCEALSGPEAKAIVRNLIDYRDMRLKYESANRATKAV